MVEIHDLYDVSLVFYVVILSIIWLTFIFIILDKLMDLMFKYLSCILKPISRSTESLFDYLYKKKW